MRRLSLLGLLILTLSPLCLRATEARVIQNIDFDWYFYPADIQGCEMDNSRFLSWRKVDVPHDYSIEGTYDQNNGRENGFLPGGGVVWYKKELEWNPLWEGKKVFIEFDGAYMNSTVWLNGYKLGFYPYGYLGFSYDLTSGFHEKVRILLINLQDNSLCVRNNKAIRCHFQNLADNIFIIVHSACPPKNYLSFMSSDIYFFIIPRI